LKELSLKIVVFDLFIFLLPLLSPNLIFYEKRKRRKSQLKQKKKKKKKKGQSGL
jgi:hypothetical protein